MRLLLEVPCRNQVLDAHPDREKQQQQQRDVSLVVERSACRARLNNTDVGCALLLVVAHGVRAFPYGMYLFHWVPPSAEIFLLREGVSQSLPETRRLCVARGVVRG